GGAVAGAAEWPVDPAGEIVPPELSRGEHVELQLELAALLEHPGAAVDLGARLVVLHECLVARAEIDAVDLAVDPSAREGERPLLRVLEAEGGLHMGRGECDGGPRLVGQEGEHEALDPAERGGGVRELAGQLAGALLGDQLARGPAPLAQRLGRGPASGGGWA